MYKGEPTEGLEFFKLLFESDEFCSELGKVTLAAGKLEAEMILLLNRHGVNERINQPTLGKLIDIGKKQKLFDPNLIIELERIKKQRNYLMHNIYSLLIDILDETFFEKKDLLDSDVHAYIEKALQLKDNLIDLTNIISKKI